MKLMLVLALALGAESAFAMGGQPVAIGPNSSWEEIQMTPGVEAAFPQITFNNVFVPVSGVCVAGDNLRTTAKVERCVRWNNSGENNECVETASDFLFTSRAFTREYCAEYTGGENNDCTRWETVTGVHALHHDVPVYRLNNGSEGGMEREFLFTKGLDIQACGSKAAN